MHNGLIMLQLINAEIEMSVKTNLLLNITQSYLV